MLPKIEHPTFVLNIPSNGNEVRMRRMLVKEEKILLLAKEEGLSQKVMAIKQVVQNCIVDDTNIEFLPTFDVEYLFIKLRARSINNIVSVIVKDGDDGKRYDAEVDLDTVEVSFENCAERIIRVTDDIGVVMQYPTFDDLNGIIDIKEKNAKSSSILVKSIDKIFNDAEVFHRGDFNEEEAAEWIETFDIQTMQKIREFFITIPKVTALLHYKDSEGKDKSMVLEGLKDFFSFA